MWDTMRFGAKMNLLAGETTVMVELLAEDDVLCQMVKSGASQADCLAHINNNF